MTDANDPDADVPPAEFRHAGRVVRLGPTTDAARDRYKWSLLAAEEGDARVGLEAGRITPDECRARLVRLEAQAARREHAAGGELWLQYMPGWDGTAEQGAAGLVLFVWSIAVDQVPGLMPADVRAALDADPAAALAAVRRVFPELLGQFADHLVAAGMMPAAKRATLVALSDQGLAGYVGRSLARADLPAATPDAR